MSLLGKNVLITGAGQNVGFGIAQRLAAAGAAIAINDVMLDRAELAARAIEEGGGKAISAAFDVTDYHAVRAGVRAIEDQIGPVDVLVNNAGIPADAHMTPFHESTPESWRPYIDLNLFGSLNTIHAVVGGMMERRFGRIIQISSGSGSMAVPGLGESMYAAGKAGAEGAVRQIAMEVGEAGVTANSLALGLMENTREWIDSGDIPALNLIWELVSTKRLGTGANIAEAILWLCSDGAGFVTGQTIHLNGGAYSGR